MDGRAAPVVKFMTALMFVGLLVGCAEPLPNEQKLRAAFEGCIVKYAENRLSSLNRSNFRWHNDEERWIRFSVEKGAMSCVGNQERFEDAYDFDSYWAGPDTGRRAALVERLDQRFHRAYMVSRNRARALSEKERRARAEGEAIDLSNDVVLCSEADPTPDPDCE
jgi:hypothetical protein